MMKQTGINRSDDQPGSAVGYLIFVPWDTDMAGGLSGVVNALYQELNEDRGFHPMLLVKTQKSPQVKPKPDSHKAVYSLRLDDPLPNGHFSAKALFTFFLRLPITLLRLSSFFKEKKIRVVNVHFIEPSAVYFAVLKMLKQSRFLFLLSFHGSDATRAFHQKNRGRIIRMILRAADGVVVPSQDLLRNIGQFSPARRDRIFHVPNGVDRAAMIRQSKAAPTMPPGLVGQRFILHIGYFHRVKAQDILVEAFRKLIDRGGVWKLLLIGRSGGNLAAIRKAIHDLRLAEHVFILTDVGHEKIASIMDRAALVTLPSRSEGCPLVILEAGVLQKAVVATRVGGIPELIGDGRSGVLVESENVQQLTDALEQVLNDEALNRTLGQHLYQRVRDHYSWERTGTAYARLVKKLLNRLSSHEF